WQDGVGRASEPWTRRELTLARDQFTEIFDRPPVVHGAAGWQVNHHVPALEGELGFRYASDTRGTGPFVPAGDRSAATVPQLPTTLPTLDELIGRADLRGVEPVGHLLAVTAGALPRDHVFTLHAELEGGAYLPSFERLLRGWQERGVRLTDLKGYAAQLDVARLPAAASWRERWRDAPALWRCSRSGRSEGHATISTPSERLYRQMDAALAPRLSPGDQDREIASTVRRERGRLLAFIRGSIADAAEAEDVLQEALYELVLAYRLMQPVEQAGAWLRRVARNRIIDRF